MPVPCCVATGNVSTSFLQECIWIITHKSRKIRKIECIILSIIRPNILNKKIPDIAEGDFYISGIGSKPQPGPHDTREGKPAQNELRIEILIYDVKSHISNYIRRLFSR